MAAARGGTVYFWRENEQPYGFLSQWYSSSFTAPPPNSPASQDLITFITTEQYMMYRKAILFNDKEIAEKIMRERTPKNQKALGRKVANFDHKTWDQHKEEIVEDGNWYKFTANNDENLKTLLVATGDKLLVEVCSRQEASPLFVALRMNLTCVGFTI